MYVCIYQYMVVCSVDCACNWVTWAVVSFTDIPSFYCCCVVLSVKSFIDQYSCISSV